MFFLFKRIGACVKVWEHAKVILIYSSEVKTCGQEFHLGNLEMDMPSFFDMQATDQCAKTKSIWLLVYFLFTKAGSSQLELALL